MSYFDGILVWLVSIIIIDGIRIHVSLKLEYESIRLVLLERKDVVQFSTVTYRY